MAFIVGFFHELYLFAMRMAQWFAGFTNTDTTELKEEEKVEHQQELEASRNVQRICLKKSLETQNQELHKTNSELDRFVYSTSHDLRAPSMLGLIAIVKESET
jgi:light-regulated signal transduction histidine kinase (bacteriophytochrome)